MSLYDPRTTALISVDLQGFVLSRPLQPYPAQQIIDNTVAIAKTLKDAGGTTIFVTVRFADDYADTLKQAVDEPMVLPPGGLPAGAFEPPPEMAALTPDVAVIKRQWSAFYGTDLDLQLRRRGIKTVILTGVATNFGVESTVRDAFARNYAVIVAEDAVTSLSPDMHEFSCTKVLPRLSLVRKTADILAN